MPNDRYAEQNDDEFDQGIEGKNEDPPKVLAAMLGSFVIFGLEQNGLDLCSDPLRTQ